MEKFVWREHFSFGTYQSESVGAECGCLLDFFVILKFIYVPNEDYDEYLSLSLVRRKVENSSEKKIRIIGL